MKTVARALLGEAAILAVKRELALVRARRQLISKARARVPAAPGELRLFIKVRNEIVRLPYFLLYYRALGVDRFFIIDNGSTDQTLEYLASQPDCHTFSTLAPLSESTHAIEVLLRRHAVGHWCVVVDADEFLVIPGPDQAGLKTVCHHLEERGYDAVHAMLLDMYSRGPIEHAAYQSGQDPLAVCDGYELGFRCMDGRRWLVGGVRERVFGAAVTLSKYPLFRHSRRLAYAFAHHEIYGAQVAPFRFALLHFKFFAGFSEFTRTEVASGQKWGGAKEYRRYKETVDGSPNLSLWFEGSRHYRGTQALLDEGILQVPPGFAGWG